MKILLIYVVSARVFWVLSGSGKCLILFCNGIQISEKISRFVLEIPPVNDIPNLALMHSENKIINKTK